MFLGLNAIAAAAVLLAGAGVASAQPYYGYGELPPPPYQTIGGDYGAASGCGGDRFTLLGAHAGVTVLGLDFDAGAGVSVPTDGYCGGRGPAFEPRPYAPPPAPVAYGAPAYAYPGYAAQSYAPQPYAPQGYAPQGYAPQSYGPPMPPQAYPQPCGCEAPRW